MRSGSNYGTFLLGSQTNLRIQTVCLPGKYLLGNTEYIVQSYLNYYYNQLIIYLNSDITGSIYLVGTSNDKHDRLNGIGTITDDTRVKTYVLFSTIDTWISSNANFSSIRIPNTAILGPDNIVNVDTIVIYAEALGENVTDIPTASVTTHTNGSFSWIVPTTGVDNSGYVIVIFPDGVDTTTDPNQNGIYQVVNTIGTGTVVYTGTDASVTDSASTAGDTYKVYNS